MPAVASSLGTTQPYIPAVSSSQLGRFAGLHMHFPVVTDPGGGTGLYEAVTAERANIAASSAIWSDKQPFTVATEPEFVKRVWSAAGQHAREVILRPGLSVTLAGDTNTVFAIAGVPSNTVGSNGDLSIDYSANVTYLKTSGAWAILSSGLYPGTYDPPTGDPANVAILVNRTDNTLSGSTTFTKTFASGVYHFNVRTNAAGQIVAIGPWGAGSSGTVAYGGVNY